MTTTANAPAAAPRPPARTRHHMSAALNFSPRAIKRDLQAADGTNAKIAIILTKVVGTMWCFWVFNGIALVSLPSAIKTGNLTIIIAWISSNWLQLILLPALMVGQNLQNEAADARAEKTFNDMEFVVSQVDTRTQGAMTQILDRIDALAGAQGVSMPPRGGMPAPGVS